MLNTIFNELKNLNYSHEREILASSLRDFWPTLIAIWILNRQIKIEFSVRTSCIRKIRRHQHQQNSEALGCPIRKTSLREWWFSQCPIVNPLSEKIMRISVSQGEKTKVFTDEEHLYIWQFILRGQFDQETSWLSLKY